MLQYAIPVIIFAYCYGRIFYVIRRQSKVVSGHAGRSQSVATVTMSRDQNITGQAQQQQKQATGAAASAKMSRAEMNVLQTMVAVIVCFMLCYSVLSISNFLQFMRVSKSISSTLPAVRTYISLLLLKLLCNWFYALNFSITVFVILMRFMQINALHNIVKILFFKLQTIGAALYS